MPLFQPPSVVFALFASTAHHHARGARAVGAHLRYAADGGWAVGGPVGLGPRRLPLIANNTRLLVLDRVRIPNLASALLTANRARPAARPTRLAGHQLMSCMCHV